MEVLESILRWLKQGQHCFLCTIVKTWGSSPRPTGSLLACNLSGETVGSLSGGCVEENLVERLHQTRDMSALKPEYLEYGLESNDENLPGLPCGGTLGLVVEPVPATSRNSQLFGSLVEQVRAGHFVTRTLNLASGRHSLESVTRSHPLEYTPNKPNGSVLRHCYGPRYELFCIGAGMVSMYLAEMALKLDYRVTVCDPRPEVTSGWPIEGIQLVEAYPDDLLRSFQSHHTMAIVALTHDPRIDDMGLLEALTTDAFYIAAMGSDRTSLNRRKRLLELGLTEKQLKRLRAPAGLAIGSKTPPEIALSIMAEITSVRSAAEASRAARISTAG